LKQSLCGSTENAKKIEADIRAQNERIISLYKRQLQTCLDDMDATFAEFKQYSTENDFEIDKDFIGIYQNALKNYAGLLPYEADLVKENLRSNHRIRSI
jgi:hypothetical protein